MKERKWSELSQADKAVIIFIIGVPLTIVISLIIIGIEKWTGVIP